MKKLLSFCIIIASSCCLQNCKRDNCSKIQPPDEYYNVTETDLSKIPFSGDDTLTYVSDAGDTANLYGQEKIVSYDHVRHGIDGPDCPWHYWDFIYQHVNYTFKGTDSLYMLKYNIYTSADYREPILHFQFNEEKSDGGPDVYNNESYYTSSIMINGKTISAIRVIDPNVEFVFNYRYGFLQIKFHPGKTWTLNVK